MYNNWPLINLLTEKMVGGCEGNNVTALPTPQDYSVSWASDDTVVWGVWTRDCFNISFFVVCLLPQILFENRQWLIKLGQTHFSTEQQHLITSYDPVYFYLLSSSQDISTYTSYLTYNQVHAQNGDSISVSRKVLRIPILWIRKLKLRRPSE